jgi:hypothetical protein
MVTLSTESLSETERVAALDAELRKHVAELFPPAQERWKIRRPTEVKDFREVFDPPTNECIRRMIAYMGETVFRETAAEIYFGHGPWYGHDVERWCGRVLLAAMKPAPALVARINERLEHLCRNAYEDIRLPRYSASFYESTEKFSCNPVAGGEPTRNTCTGLLLSAVDRQDAREVLKKIASGSLNYGPFDVVLPVYSGVQKPEERRVRLRSYQRFQQDMFPVQMSEILIRLAEAGELTQELLGAAMRNLPETLNWMGPDQLAERASGSETSRKAVAEMANQFAKEVSANFDAEWFFLPSMYGYKKGCWIRGSWALLAAARHHQRLTMKKLKISGSSYFFDFFDAKDRRTEIGVIQLANAGDTEPSEAEERKQLVSELRKFPRKTLEALLPVALRSPQILCEALGWEAGFPLIDVLYSEAKLPGHHDYYPDKYPHKDATGNSPDPSNGVIDVAKVRKLIAVAGTEVAGKILTAMVDSNGAAANTAMLFAAVGGFNAADVAKKLAKRNQTAVKAMGLLPLIRGKAEAVERYIAIRQFEEESAEFGPERKANERAAAQAALANLAQVAGYPNVLRLEWAMEAELGTQTDPLGRTWKVGEHRAELVIEGEGPKLRFYSKDKALKAAPWALKSSPPYEGMKQLLASTKQQYKRLKTTFERMMNSGEPLSGADLEMLSRLPIANRLLSRLVLATEAGSARFFGTWTSGALTGLGGKKRKVAATENMVIAHTYDLFAQDQLAAWQAEFVRREWVQPFRQVFREVYLPFEAERSKEECHRFAGQVIKTGVATKLLASRGWEFRNSGRVEVYYFDRAKEILAEWLFPDAGGHYLAEQERTVAGVIRFAKGVPEGERTRIDRKLQLGEVPPSFLSEILRDADLVCSVAAAEAKAQPSSEVQQRRADAVRAVLSPLELECVSFEGDFVRVKGKLAEYKVSCANASITREPGKQTYMFPAGTRLQNEKLFLPFADEDDELLSAVCTAVLILAHDDQIKDKSLLRALGVSKE